MSVQNVPVCQSKNVPVCPSKTSQCVRAPRAHVFQHVRVVPACTGTFLTDTREEREVSSSVLLTEIRLHRVITCPRGSKTKKPINLAHFKFENRFEHGTVPIPPIIRFT